MTTTAFDPYQENLPITAIFDQVKQHLTSGNTLILSAPPGAGKSTLLPLALMQEKWLGDQKIIMLEPRRLAAKSIAKRLAALIGENVGESIGYRIRFETCVSEQTKIEILTEGILTRMLQNDNTLEGVGMVIFDEFHERSIHADVALALARETQTVLRDDLRLLIMSATLNQEKLVDLLNAPLVKSEGRQYPVDVRYLTDADPYSLPELTAAAVLNALKAEKEGDILVFLPGQAEIKKCAALLNQKTDDIWIHELYGQLPFSKQQAAILPNRAGKRKIVIATDIAETSLTIEGVTIVVDSGFRRIAQFDPKSGLSGLKTVRIAKDSADQRAGRAGRLSPGVCYRMWSTGTHQHLAMHSTPEILEADLTPLMLDLANWGINSIHQLDWVDTPAQHPVKEARKTLEELGALQNGKITTHGKAMNQLPTHPRIAQMLLTAKEEGLLNLATDLAATVEERDPLPKETGIDITLRIEALRRYRQNNGKGGPFARIEKVAKNYRKLFNLHVENDAFDPYEAGLLLVHAYPERIAFARPGNNAQFQLANGKYAMAGHKDDLAYEAWLAIAHLNDRDHGTGKIFLAAPLNPTDLAPFVKELTITKWDTRQGGVIAATETRIGNIVLKSTPIQNPDQELLTQAISDAVAKEGEHLLDFNDEVTQWQNRIISLKKWNPTQPWPDVTTATLLETNVTWLSPYFTTVKKPEDLKKINLKEVLQFSLTYAQQETLNELAPERITVPSGSSIRLNYQENGSAPILAVRIQEIFGLKETPTVNDGKKPVLLHLLSPGYKPAQITGDLSSFWATTYFEVRKELRSRYKKHAWPDNPLTHPPLKGTKKQAERDANR